MNLICKLGINLILILKRVHDRGYVHRNINPKNILLGENNNWNNVHLIDYSLSRLMPKVGIY